MNQIIQSITRTKKHKKSFVRGLLFVFMLTMSPLFLAEAYIVDNYKIDKRISDEGITFTYNEVEQDAILPDDEPTTVVTTGGSSGGGGGRYDASNWLLQQVYDDLVAAAGDDYQGPTHAAAPLEYDPIMEAIPVGETYAYEPVETEETFSPEISTPTVTPSPETEEGIVIKEVETADKEIVTAESDDLVAFDDITPDWIHQFFVPTSLSFEKEDECVALSRENILLLDRQMRAFYNLICALSILLIALLILQAITFSILYRQALMIKAVKSKKTMPKSKRATSRKKGLKNLLFLLALGLVPLMMTPEAQANTFDTEKVYYQGVLKDDDENPLTGQYTFRFSAWLTQDFISGEVVGGEIVTASPQYLDWQEAQTQDIVDGEFLFRLGEILALPEDLFVDHYVYLQIEVKESSQANTEYELIDNDADTTIDRLKFFAPVPYARNTDTLDFRAAGYTAGDIPYLDANGKLPEDIVYSSTKENTFTLDSDGDAAATDTLTLTFGDTLGKTLSWNGLADQFEFNDSVAISGDLLVLGTINGVTVGTKDITDTLSPMYDNSVFVPDGTNNKGSMYEEDDNQKNILRWTTTNPALQDYDVQIRYTLPSDFEEFSGTDDISLTFKTDGLATEAKIDVSLQKGGDAVTEQLTGTITGLSSNTWIEQDFSLNPVTTWSAGDVMIFKIKAYASSTKDAYLGDIKINYTIN